MKKAFARLLALAIIISSTLTPALAVTNISDAPEPVIGVEYAPVDVAMSPITTGIVDNGRGNIMRAYSVQDLGTNNSVGVDWLVPGSGAVRSSYNYKTGSGKIVLRVTGSSTVSIVFGLYDTTDARVAEYTVQVTSTKTAIITFSNLFTNKEYYVKADNVSQSPTTLTGTIAAA